jgi:hypothetical protein
MIVGKSLITYNLKSLAFKRIIFQEITIKVMTGNKEFIVYIKYKWFIHSFTVIIINILFTWIS